MALTISGRIEEDDFLSKCVLMMCLMVCQNAAYAALFLVFYFPCMLCGGDD